MKIREWDEKLSRFRRTVKTSENSSVPPAQRQIAEDKDGELYIVDHDGGGIYRLAESDGTPTPI